MSDPRHLTIKPPNQGPLLPVEYVFGKISASRREPHYNERLHRMISLALVLAAALSPLYENNFSTRASYDLPPGVAWTKFKYTPGIPLADNYEARGLATNSGAWYTRPYSWVPDQDGWTKSVGFSLRANYVHTTVSSESNPALVFSNKDVYIYDTDTYAKDHQTAVMHPLRNVFTNGMLKAQFDIQRDLLCIVRDHFHDRTGKAVRSGRYRERKDLRMGGCFIQCRSQFIRIAVGVCEALKIRDVSGV